MLNELVLVEAELSGKKIRTFKELANNSSSCGRSLEYPFFLCYPGLIILLKYFFCEIEIVHGAFALSVIKDDWFANAWRFADTCITVNDGIEYHLIEMFPHFTHHLVA